MSRRLHRDGSIFVALVTLTCACAGTPSGRLPAKAEESPDTVVELDSVPLAPEAVAAQRELNATRGTLVGRVTDAESGLPVTTAGVHTSTMGGYADERGEYRVVYLHPGSTEMRIEAPGYAPEHRTHTFVAGRVDTLDVALRHSAPVRLALPGIWTARFHLRELGTPPAKPRRWTVVGTITFSDSIPSPYAGEEVPRDRFVWTAFGLSQIDFTPFFGARIAPGGSTTVFGPTDGTFEREVIGTVLDGDSVEVSLIPRISHGGVSFEGRMHGDSIVGRWYLRAYCCGASGDVVLRRQR